MPKTLLIVDDEASMRRLYSRVFSCEGYSCTLTGSLSEAKNLLGSNSYDLLITDIQLGDGSGLELIELAKTFSGTKTIMISGAFELADLRFMASQHDVPAYFGKPFRVDDLLDAVEDLLERRG